MTKKKKWNRIFPSSDSNESGDTKNQNPKQKPNKMANTKDSLTQLLAQQLCHVYMMNGKLGVDMSRNWACAAVNRTIKLIRLFANEGIALPERKNKPAYDANEVIAEAEVIAWSILRAKQKSKP